MCGDEERFTKLSNKLFDTLQRFHCGELKKEIMLNLIRQTAGYHRESVLTSASAIASYICRNKVKTRQALQELIECDIVISEGKEGPGRTRRLSINMDTSKWRHNALPEDAEEYKINQTHSTLSIKTEETQPIQSPGEPSHLGSSERSQMDTSFSDSGSFKQSPTGLSERSQTGYTPPTAYIVGKNEISGPKENIKENYKRYIYICMILL